MWYSNTSGSSKSVPRGPLSEDEKWQLGATSQDSRGISEATGEQVSRSVHVGGGRCGPDAAEDERGWRSRGRFPFRVRRDVSSRRAACATPRPVRALFAERLPVLPASRSQVSVCVCSLQC